MLWRASIGASVVGRGIGAIFVRFGLLLFGSRHCDRSIRLHARVSLTVTWIRHEPARQPGHAIDDGGEMGDLQELQEICCYMWRMGLKEVQWSGLISAWEIIGSHAKDTTVLVE